LFESVLAFGDSHVAGYELSDDVSLLDYTSGKITIEQADSAGKQFSFSQIVADAFKIPCHNYAMSGGSNLRSIRLLTQAVQQYPKSLVLFGYTCTDRTEFYYPDKGNFLGRDKDDFIQVGLQWETDIKKSNLKHPINDIYLNHMLRPYNNLDQMIFIVNNICANHAARFLHIPLFPEEFQMVGNTINFEGWGNYLDWCKVRKFAQQPHGHYGRDAHKALAQLILNNLLK
jgi:hypothetical protein